MGSEARVLAALLQGLLPTAAVKPLAEGAQAVDRVKDKEPLAGATTVLEPSKDVASPSVSLRAAVPVVELPPESTALNGILKTKETIERVKANLSSIIDGIGDNPSLISKASGIWGKWSLAQKVVVGAVLCVPAASVGVATGFSALLTLGALAGATYTAAGLTLEDHNACTVQIKQKLKEGILSITDVLAAIIIDLDDIRINLATQVSKFKEENMKLALHVTSLQDQISTLTIQVELLISIEAFIRRNKEELEKQIDTLKSATVIQTEQLEEAQKKFNLLNTDYEKQQKDLAAKVEELRLVREEMATEVAKTKKVSAELEVTVETLAAHVTEDKTKKDTLTTQLASIVGKEEKTVHGLLTRMSATTGELESAKNDLQSNNTQHKALLTKQEELIKRLEKLDRNLILSLRAQRSGGGQVSGVSHFRPAKPLQTPSGSVTSTVRI